MDPEPVKSANSEPDNSSWKEMYGDLYQFCLEKILVCSDEQAKEGLIDPNQEPDR